MGKFLILKMFVLGLYGEISPDLKFNLQGIGGKTYNESIFAQKNRKIIFFISPHCRISRKFYEYISDLTKTHKSTFNRFYLISPNYIQALLPDDLAYTDLQMSIEGMETLSKRYGFEVPFIFDGNQEITKALDINTTPSVVFLNEENNIIYKGKIGEITPKGSVETTYFDQIINGNYSSKTVITKVRGTEIKTAGDMPATSRILQRYANETVKLVYADKEKIEFFMKFHNRKAALFFLWQLEDRNCRENLLKVTEIYKIYRKRGLSLITICISGDEENILENLKQAQSSAYNFKSDFYQTNQLYSLSDTDGPITPMLVVVDKKGKQQFKHKGDIEIQELRTRVLRLLN